MQASTAAVGCDGAAGAGGGDAPNAPAAPAAARQPLRVGGVPEHFNLPWHAALEAGLFAAAGVDVEWVSQPLGTGQMLKSLREGSVDVIVALT
jgi:ABC-type nitrate/sulfonate/bicarbonate transport system substrate-binding protein